MISSNVDKGGSLLVTFQSATNSFASWSLILLLVASKFSSKSLNEGSLNASNWSTRTWCRCFEAFSFDFFLSKNFVRSSQATRSDADALIGDKFQDILAVNFEIHSLIYVLGTFQTIHMIIWSRQFVFFEFLKHFLLTLAKIGSDASILQSATNSMTCKPRILLSIVSNMSLEAINRSNSSVCGTNFIFFKFCFC